MRKHVTTQLTCDEKVDEQTSHVVFRDTPSFAPFPSLPFRPITCFLQQRFQNGSRLRVGFQVRLQRKESSERFYLLLFLCLSCLILIRNVQKSYCTTVIKFCDNYMYILEYAYTGILYFMES